MKNNKKKKVNNDRILYIALSLLTTALFSIKLLSGFNSSDGYTNILLSHSYPFILLLGHLLILAMICIVIKKAGKNTDMTTYLLPVMLTAGLGMIKIDSDVPIRMEQADFRASGMFLILFAAVILMLFSKNTLSGIAGTLAGSLVSPAFGLCFTPFIVAFAYLNYKGEKKKKLISLGINTAAGIAGIIYCIIKTDIAENLSFDKKYIPALALIAVLFIFFIYRKDYDLLPVAVLPVFPLTAGIVFGTFATPLFTLSASVAPLVLITVITALTDGNKKIKGYAQQIVHNPALYIVVTVFIIHTAYSLFALPGKFVDTYTAI